MKVSRHLGNLAYMALRYAMGRCSTAPTNCADAIRAAWPDLEIGDRAILLRDLTEELARHNARGELLGHQCDHDVWTALLAFMRKEATA